MGVAGLGVLLYVAAMIVAQEKNDWLWPVAGLIGGAGAVVATYLAAPEAGTAVR